MPAPVRQKIYLNPFWVWIRKQQQQLVQRHEQDAAGQGKAAFQESNS